MKALILIVTRGTPEGSSTRAGPNKAERIKRENKWQIEEIVRVWGNVGYYGKSMQTFGLGHSLPNVCLKRRAPDFAVGRRRRGERQEQRRFCKYPFNH